MADRNDLMYKLRFENPTTLGRMSPEELRDAMYAEHVAAAKEQGIAPAPLRDFSEQVGYSADVYSRRGTELADYGANVAAGGAAFAGAAASLGGRLFGVRPEDNPLATAADDAEQYWRDTQSEGYRYSQAQPGVTKEKVFGAVTGSLLPLMAGAGVARLATLPYTLSRGGAATIAAAKAGDVAAKARLAKVGLVAGAGSEGLVSGAMSARDTYNQVRELPIEQLAESPEFLQELEDTDPRLPPEARIEAARNALADSISLRAGVQVGGATLALGGIGGGAILGRYLRGEGAGIKDTLVGGTREFLEEAGQSAAETFLGQRQAARADVRIDPLEGIEDAALIGGITGGIYGVAGSQLGRLRRRDITPQLQGLSDQNDLLQARPEVAVEPAAPEAFLRDAEPVLRPGLGRALAPQTDLLSRDERTIAVTPYRAEELPVLGERPSQAMPSEFDLAEIENRRAELNQILASATAPAQRRAIQAELDALPLPPLEFTPVERPVVPALRQPVTPQMPEVRMPAVQRTLFGAPEQLEQEGPQIPPQAIAPEFALEVQEAPAAIQEELPLPEAQVAAPVADPRQAAMDLRTREERTVAAQQQLAEPIPTLRELMPTLPRGITPSRMMAIAAVRANADLPITEALPAIAKALKPVKLAGETKAKVTEFLRHFKQQSDTISARRTALQADLVQQPEVQTDGPVTAEARSPQAQGIERGGVEREAVQGTPEVSAVPLKNAPANVTPSLDIREVAEAYMREAGISAPAQTDYVKVDVEKATEIARLYEEAVSTPDDPMVREAYAAMIEETLAQYQAIKRLGMKFEMIPEGFDPYPEGPKQALEDMRNGHLWVFPTASGFGQEGQQPSLLEAPTDEYIGDYRLLANDVFRIVHDVFGHGKEGNGFGPIGEENAWQSHVRMYSPLAARAMTTETRGQNSWLNYGPHGEHNRSNQRETIFAEQKMILLPEWVSDIEGEIPRTEPKALFSLNTQSPLVEVFQKLGSAEEAYRSGVSTSSNLQTVLNDVLGKERGWEVLAGGNESAIIKLDNVAVATIHFDEGAIREHHKPEAGIFIPENSVVVQIMPGFPDFGQGAGLGQVYQAIFNWALNTGRTVRPDSGGLTPVNALRRSEQMLTSMLRTGTSEHVVPHWTQLAPLAMNMGIKPSPATYLSTLWGDESQAGTPEERAAIYQANLHNLLLASSLMAHGAPRSKADAKEGKVQGLAKLGTWVADTEGKLYEVQSKGGALRFNPVEDLDAAIPAFAKKEFGVGPTTARRAVVTRQALLGITPAGLGNFGRVAAESAYRFERGSTAPTAPARTMAGYPGLARMEPGQGFWHRLFYSVAPSAQSVAGTPDVQRVVDEVTAQWGDTAKVRVVESVADLPPEVQAQFERNGGPGTALEGVYLPATGEVVLIAPNIRSADRAREVLAHEAVGHYAMEKMTSMEHLVPQIQMLEKGKAPAVVEAAAWVDANQKKLSPEVRAKEIIAVLAERGEHKRVPLLKRMVAALRNWLRNKGFARGWVDTLSENDVLYLLRHAEAYLRNPKGYPQPLLANVPSWRDRVELAPEEQPETDYTSSQALASVNLKRKALAQKKNVSMSALNAQAFGYSLDQLANSFAKYLPALPEYYDLHGRRDAAMTESLKPAEDLFSEWAAWAATNGEAQAKLGQFAIESTRRNIHADRSYKNEAEMVADQPWLKKQPNAFSDYLALNREWQTLPAEAKKWYATIRDFYSKQWKEVKQEMQAFVERQTEPGSEERTQMLQELDREFGRVQGPYFPLMRLGEYLVIAEGPGLERVVSAVETPAQQSELAEELKARGYTKVSTKVARDYNQVTDGVPSQFVESMDKMIDARMDADVINRDVGNEMKAFINQLYLHSLPDVTGRKMLMNRQGVAGAEQDLLRVFAKSSYQTSFLKSRLRWQSQIREALNSIEQEVREVTAPDSERFDPEADGNAMSTLLNELKARYALQAQPDPTPALSKVQSLMYMWYLGLAPAYYMTNLLQVPIVTTPELTKKYPTAKVLAALTKAYAKALPIVTSTWWKDSRMFARSGVVKGAYDFDAAKNLTPDERAMLKRGILDGRLDVTLAYDLGNVAMGNSPTWHKISKGVTYMGHTTEVLNRMATALAAYDLSKDLAYTWRVVDSTQFNYAAYNKPRFMNPKYGKGLGLVFQFQQYRQRMVYNVAKAFRDSVTNDKTMTPQEKREARRYLAGVIGTHFLFAGLVGIPFAMTFVQLVNAILNAARDDEEPEVDILMEGRKALSDMAENFMSEDAARATSETILKGVPRTVNVDLSGRVGAGEILPWARETAKGKTGKDWFYEQFATTIGGPFGGFLANAAEAKEKADQGKVAEAIATTSPRAMRDLLNAYLLGTKGVRTGGGYDTGFEPTDTEVFLKTIGLQPARLAEFQEARGEIIGRQQKLRSQRSLLKKQWVMAKQENDHEEMREIQARIRVFNRANPTSRIQQGDLYKELKRIDKLMHDPNFYMGVKLNKGERAMAGEVSEEFNTEE